MVRRAATFEGVLGLAVLLALPVCAQQQDNGASQQKQGSAAQQNQSGQNGNEKKDQKKSTADQNPFPEQQSEAAAKQAQGTGSPQNDARPQDENAGQREEKETAPNAPQPSGQKGSTADQNPFPEQKSEKAAGGDQPQGAGNGGQDYSSSQVKGLALPGTAAGPASGPQPYNPNLAKKDTQVGTFYMQSGNLKGAYDRFEEATREDPGNAEAVYGLGESALKLGKRDEAVKNFRLYLAALPEGTHAKEIRKAMKQMGVPES